MAALRFVPQDVPQADFVIVRTTTPAIDDLLTDLGAYRVTKENYTLYSWYPVGADTLFFGAGVVDGRFYVGPTTLAQQPSHFGAGTYTVIGLGDSVATIQPDIFGMNMLFYSDSLVTNRLHLAALILRSIDVNNAISVFYGQTGFSFNFNMLTTPVKGVQVLPTHSRITVGGNGVVVSTHVQDFSVLEPDEYWELIHAGAEDVAQNVSAVVNSGYPVLADISGGRDSRIIFGALVSQGLQHRVIFNTIAQATSPMLALDLRIGSGLVARYGGSYEGMPRIVGFSHNSVAQNIERRRSHIFGSYHWITPADFRPVSGIFKTPVVRMLGGGGEMYRTNWGVIEFSKADPELPASAEHIAQALRQPRGRFVSDEMVNRFFPDLLHTFEVLPGQKLGDKIESHYVNLRSRLHFAARPILPENSVSISLATSPYLLRAFRGLPAAEQRSGRVIYDVLSVFDPQLPLLEFEVPYTKAVFDSRYHRGSTIDQAGAKVEGAEHLVMDRRITPYPIPSRRPVESEWDFRTSLESEVSESLAVISRPDSSFAFFVDDHLKEFVEWAQEHNPNNYAALASKLRFLADLDQIAR
ncbi:MAG: hypothetical protein SPI12_03435 [Actinomycetaceae bacterium]|nr:hypothetical protein [Actinomycetaceae bacterium]MDY6082899.1 hypothetical protein [Actinomycetaceae bacterium]